jgi:hypothetical protein
MKKLLQTGIIAVGMLAGSVSVVYAKMSITGYGPTVWDDTKKAWTVFFSDTTDAGTELLPLLQCIEEGKWTFAMLIPKNKTGEKKEGVFYGGDGEFAVAADVTFKSSKFTVEKGKLREWNDKYLAFIDREGNISEDIVDSIAKGKTIFRFSAYNFDEKIASDMFVSVEEHSFGGARGRVLKEYVKYGCR